MFRYLALLTLIALQSLTIVTPTLAGHVTLGKPNTAAASSTSADGEDNKQRINYLFDQDVAGVQCQKTIEKNDDETFRLFCINKPRSFKLCSVSCSNALHFEGTVGSCLPHRCSFYGHQFENIMEDGTSLSMSKIAQGKVTFVAVVPLWQAQAQYFYELMEYVKSLEPDNVEGMVLPLYVEDKEPVAIEPLKDGNAQVTILKTVQPENLMSHPFLSFLQSLTHVSGFVTFDIYIDRPVFFAVSHDGNMVERMVAPTKDTLMEAVEKYSKGYTTSEEM